MYSHHAFTNPHENTTMMDLTELYQCHIGDQEGFVASGVLSLYQSLSTSLRKSDTIYQPNKITPNEYKVHVEVDHQTI